MLKSFCNRTHVIIKWLGTQDYHPTWQAMKQFTHTRNLETTDELWLLEHPPVFTQGQSGKAEHVLNPRNIPIIQTDRGGQVTYHGPGQLMVYTLINLKRKSLNIRDLVSILEQSVIDLLAAHQVQAYAKPKAPGVYVDEKKLASIGLRIRQGFAYHGMAMNVDMNLEPFSRINPCGMSNLKMIQCADLIGKRGLHTTAHEFINYLMNHLRYTTAQHLFINKQ